MSISLIICDDHAIVRDGLRMIFEMRNGFEVVGEAANGREAVELAKQLKPDIVLMDIAMPEMNGIEATRAIRLISPSTKVIILSMYATKEHIYRALQAGAAGYLLKESAGSEVVAAVRTVNTGKNYMSSKLSETIMNDLESQRFNRAGPSPFESLSQREKEVFQLTVEGKSTTEIADALQLSHSTVVTYRSRLMHKLGISDLPALVRFAIQHEFIHLN